MVQVVQMVSLTRQLVSRETFQLLKIQHMPPFPPA
jgi:hypothetical protein